MCHAAQNYRSEVGTVHSDLQEGAELTLEGIKYEREGETECREQRRRRH